MAENSLASESKEKLTAKLHTKRNSLLLICIGLGVGCILVWFAFGQYVIAFALGGACIVFAMLAFDAHGHEYEVNRRPDRTISLKHEGENPKKANGIHAES